MIRYLTLTHVQSYQIQLMWFHVVSAISRSSFGGLRCWTSTRTGDIVAQQHLGVCIIIVVYVLLWMLLTPFCVRDNPLPRIVHEISDCSLYIAANYTELCFIILHYFYCIIWTKLTKFKTKLNVIGVWFIVFCYIESYPILVS